MPAFAWGLSDELVKGFPLGVFDFVPGRVRRAGNGVSAAKGAGVYFDAHVEAMAWVAQSSRPTRRVCQRSAAMPRRSEIAARLARRNRTPPCRTRPCTRSVREGCPNRAFFMENKRPGLLDLITSLFPGAAREQKGEVDPSMQSAKVLHGGTPS